MSARPNERTIFWAALSPADREELRRLGHGRLFPAGTVIFDQDDRSDYVLVLRSGCVKVASHADDGYQAVLALRDAGDLLGELASLDGGPRSASLYALTDVEALIISAVRFTAFRRARPGVEAAVQRILSARLREADRYRTAAGADTVPQRLALLLLRLAHRYGREDGSGGFLIDLPLSQDDLAGLVLTSKRTIGRVLEQWREHDWVATGRRTILVLDPEALRRLSAT